MKTLIITVGTRQIGWCCQDGLVRSLGADGDRGHPKHIDELYAELGIERGYHGDRSELQFTWSVRHLGEQFYGWCELHEDFGAVELLLDGKILEQEIQDGLTQIILWGTDQPETVAWNFRRADTVWLARLIAGKIRQTWPEVNVDVWSPNITANDIGAIRQEFEGFLLEYIRESTHQSGQDLTLMIETKGSAPSIANTLEICAAALTRQYTVVQVNPIEPTPLFATKENGVEANRSVQYVQTSIGEFFWPMERERIRSAWERGDFSEAKVWLEAHRDRYDGLYRLAEILSLASNLESDKALKSLRDQWLRSKAVDRMINDEQRQVFQDKLAELMPTQSTSTSKVGRVWENLLWIELNLKQENYTTAFLQFSQMLEKLLCVRAKQERWVSRAIISMPPNYKGSPEEFNPGFGSSLRGLAKLNKMPESSSEWKLLDSVIRKRNEITHEGVSINIVEMRGLWTKAGYSVSITSDHTEVLRLMMDAFDRITSHDISMPKISLMKALHELGLAILRT
jgi:hypothetical protein